MKTLLTTAALALAVVASGAAVATAAPRACPCCAGGRWELVWERVEVTTYDACGCPHTASKWVLVCKPVTACGG